MNGLRHGYGVSTCPNGDRYEGEWRNDKAHGKGAETWGIGLWKGDRYEGDFVEGKRHGKGNYYAANSNRYEGDWVESDMSGKGIFKWGHGEFKGARYEGDFVKGVRTGKGTYYWPNGNRYEGDWLRGDYTGEGVFYWANGDRYEGDFVDDYRSGKGVFYWANRNRYEGDFVEGDRTGKGTFYWGYGKYKGDRYEGDFVKGVRTGKGTYYWPSGNHYEGDWVDNEITGEGIKYRADGSRYEGQWRKGDRRGDGIEYDIDGKAYIQEWRGTRRSSVAAQKSFSFLRELALNFQDAATLPEATNWCSKLKSSPSIADGILVWDAQKNRFLSPDGESIDGFFDDLSFALEKLNKECRRGSFHPKTQQAVTTFRRFLAKHDSQFKWQVNYNKQLLADKAYEASLISVTIGSTPVPGTLFIDDQVEGETPQNLRLEPRTYSIRIKQGDLDRTVTIDPREESNYTISLVDPEEEQRKANEAKKRQQEKEEAEKRIAEKERLRREQEMSLVKEIQSMLIESRYMSGSVDGVMGTKSRAALKAFYFDAGLDFPEQFNPQVILGSINQHLLDSDNSCVVGTSGGDWAVCFSLN